MNLQLLMVLLESCGVGCSLLILVSVLILRRTSLGKQQFDVLFILIIIMNTLMLLTDALSRSYDGVSGEIARWIEVTVNPAEFLFNEALLVLFTFYLAAQLEAYTWEVKTWRILAWCVAAAFVVIQCYNFFTGDVFYIDAANCYTRGRNYSVYMIPAGVLQIANITMILRFRWKLPRMIKQFSMSIAFVPIVCCVLQYFFSSVPFIQLGCFYLAVLVFFTTQGIFSEQLQLQQRKEIEQEHRMLIAQLQPHFLYNALIAIMGIEGNPPETVDAITSFSKYLRGSLNSLKQEDTIPAEQELKHVQAYVQLEQLRYSGKLDIRTDIQETGFYLPPLSLQMLVENSIRHGFSGMERPGIVTISSKALNEWYIVTVEDNGCGFDTDAILKDPGTHVGLHSVKRRVETMCHGQLVIRSTPGVGTRASILIPKDEARDQKHETIMKYHIDTVLNRLKEKGGKDT